MKKRIILDVFLDEDEFNRLKSKLSEFKAAAINISKDEKSSITIHDCGHDEGKQCTNIERIL